jgi:TonB family protein
MFNQLNKRKVAMMLSPLRVFHLLRLPSLLAATILCGCAASRMAFEGNPMPQEQVASFLQVLSPQSAYDTPPKFLKGFAPFFPDAEAKKRNLGYAVAEFTVNADGKVSNIRITKATSDNFAEEAGYTVRDWTFAPAQKNGQRVPTRVRLPFTFRQS